MTSDPEDPSPLEPATPSDAAAPSATAEPVATQHEIDPARLDSDAVRVVLRLRQHGHEAFLVGGCVRDLLVGRAPKDFDIATSATPPQVKDLFRNCRLIGRRFRLAHVYFKGGKVLEVSTFRANPTEIEEPQPSEALEGEVRSDFTADMAEADLEGMAEVERAAIEASRVGAETPDEPAPLEDEASDVFITQDNVFGNEIEDARRRDFTINGLFYDVAQGKVIDHVNGMRDLRLAAIRTIGDPELRMREDPVRLLRAVRFACKLDFEIEPRTYAAMEGAVEDLPRCSAPRLLEETFRLIRGGIASRALKLLWALDALKILLPPVDAHIAKLDTAGRDEFFDLVEAMDSLVRQGQAFDDSMLLAGVLLPLAMEEPEPAGDSARPSMVHTLENLLVQLVRASRLPRRIAERCRLILLAQRTLSGERRRRGGLMTFRRHPLFNEALRVFQVWVTATGEHEAELELWKTGQAPTPKTDAPGPRRRRKRRRGNGPEPKPA